MNSKRDIWFPAKRYGWGWGFPMRWQGWVVLLAYCALVVLGIPYIRNDFGPIPYVVFLLIITAVFIGVCWWKGETPRWRWGDDDSSNSPIA